MMRCSQWGFRYIDLRLSGSMIIEEVYAYCLGREGGVSCSVALSNYSKTKKAAIAAL